MATRARTTTLSKALWSLVGAGLLLAGDTRKPAPADEPAQSGNLVHFETQQLDRRFFSEGAAGGDLDRDGHPDIVSGPYWYRGPHFTHRHELEEPKPVDPHGYSDVFFQFVHDVDRDGWNDVVLLGFPGRAASWLENPGDPADGGHWQRHLALDSVDNESPAFVDLTGDGRPEIVCSVGGSFGYASIPETAPEQRWTFHRITPDIGASKFTHGLGVGDVDGDGRADLLEKGGWWRQPESLAGDPLWERHPVAFAGPGGAQMFVRDVDGDGLGDVITSLAAHGWGLAWYRAGIGEDGERTFERRLIIGEKPSDSPYRVAFSQIHAIDVADIDGDGIDDIVTGKRYWAHGPQGDPEPDAPAVVYWFRCSRRTDPTTGKTTAEFVPHLVHDDSGVGVEVKATDVSGDGLPDIVVGNKRGSFVHVQSRQAVSRETYEDASPRPRRAMVEGLPATEAAAHMTVPPGFTVRLMASEPDVRQPIAMAFDDRGRLWVAEAYSYPVRVADAEARDRILIFEDTDGDDVFDSRKVFVEGLNLVSGLELGFGGVWVGAAPELLFYPDRDGDDRPDGEPEVLLDGWGYQDTHETLNAFIWGPDGWLYGCHGVFTHSAVGPPGATDAERVKLNAGIWRYHPVRRTFEVFAEGTSNPWGVDFNDVGDAFETACVIPHLYHVIQNARYQRQAGQHFNPWTFDDIKTIARHRHWTGGQWHNADREKSDLIGGGHAHSGAMVYLGGAWPERYRGRLFMNNIHGARLNVDRLEASASGYEGDGDPDFLFANDTSSQFVALQYGPDGQVVVIDWYDRNQCHRREVEAHDRDTGRIFKVAAVGAGSRRIEGPRNVAVLDDAALVDLLDHDNDWFVRHARRLLQERAAAGRLDTTTAGRLASRLGTAASGPKRLRVAWAMHAAGVLSEADQRALLADADPHVRGWGVQLACEPLSPTGDAVLPTSVRDRILALAESDPSPVVRRFIASAVGRMPPQERWAWLPRLIGHAEDADDHNLPLLYWYAVEPVVESDPQRALGLAAAGGVPSVSRFVVRRLAAEERFYEPLVAAVTTASSADRAWMLGEIATALAARGRAGMPRSWQDGYEQLKKDESIEVRRLADEVAARFGDPRVLPILRAVVADRAAAEKERLSALESLVAARDAALPPLLHGLLAEDALRGPMLSALAAVPHDGTPGAVLARYARLPQADRQAAIATLTSRPEWTLALLDAIERKDVPRDDLAAFTVGRLAESADSRVLARLAEVWGTVRATPADRKAEFERWRKQLDDKALAVADLSHGREVYARTCGTCHVLHGVGAKIGPELTGSHRADLGYLLSNLIDPSALVGRDYQMTQIVTDDGRVLGGIVVAESPQAVTLQAPTERVVVPVADIETRTLSEQSLMPENQLAQLDVRSAVDLVAYLRHPTQVPLPGEGPPPFNGEGRIAGAVEGESLVPRSPPTGRLARQGMAGFPAGRWSGSSQAWWTGAKPGDRLVLEVPVHARGPHEVFAILTKAPDYASVMLTWQAAVATGPVDLYDQRVIPLLPVSLGVHDLEPGTATLAVEISGANPKARPAYMFGLDCLVLVPRAPATAPATSPAPADASAFKPSP